MRFVTILSLALLLFAPANGFCKYTRGKTVLYNSRTKSGAGKAEPKRPPEKPVKRVLVVFYSWDENTERAARLITRSVKKQEHFQILYTACKIKLENDYNTNDFDICIKQAKEQIIKKDKPKIYNVPDDVSGYDIIFLGSPNWWDTIAPPLLSFTEKMKDYRGPVAPFITRGSSGLGHCEEDLKKALPKAKVLHAGLFSGKRLGDHDELEELSVKEWAKGILDLHLN
ncbi:hypothetical protein IJS98_02770 [bacterium]|nr:hypothetical protein [bacterium]